MWVTCSIISLAIKVYHKWTKTVKCILYLYNYNLSVIVVYSDHRLVYFFVVDVVMNIFTGLFCHHDTTFSKNAQML